MEKDWSPVFKTDNVYQVEIIKGMLEENGIESVIINKRDSAYTSFGTASLYVHNDNIVRAKQLIEESEGNED